MANAFDSSPGNHTGIVKKEAPEDNEVHDQLPAVEEIRSSNIRAMPGQLFWAPWRTRAAFLLLVILVVGIILLLVTLGTRDGSFEDFRATGETPTDGELSPGAPTSEFVSRLDDVLDFLVREGISNPTTLAEEDSPQRIAAQWIADGDRLQVEIGSRIIQRYALAVFYFALGGTGWAVQLSFLQGEHECKWYYQFTSRYGVFCNDKLEVNKIQIPGNWLRGTIPNEIRHLPQLEHLFLAGNPSMTGRLPDGMSSLTKITSLSLHYNSLSGILPGWLGDLTNLEVLLLGNNYFLTGPIPPSFAKLTNMQYLGLDDNTLQGKLEIFGSMTQLVGLYLEDNFFVGSISEFMMSNWSKLEELDVSSNYLSSGLPTNLFASENLRVLDLHANSFVGALPDVVSERTKLAILSLQKNSLSGTIPPRLADLSNLKHLDLSSNELTSTVPDSFGALQDLRYLFISMNPLDRGSIPSCIQKMSRLRDLSLKHTNLIGEVPLWMGSLSRLQLLDLDNNFLKGMVPSSIGNLTALRYLLLNRNQFSGPIPTTFAFLSNLDVVLLENNSFTGNTDMLCQSFINLDTFVADCNGSKIELECSCCSLCCQDDGLMCNDADWLGTVDPVWEYEFSRAEYEFLDDLSF